MKKILLLLVCLLISAPVFAVGSEGFDKSSSKNPVISKATANISIMRAQIDATNSKYNSATRVYKSAIDNLSTILLSEETLKKANGNLDLQLNALNKYLKSPKATEDFRNLTISQKVSIKKDINILSSVQNSFIQLDEQTKKVISTIKSDDFYALSLKSDLNNLVKIQSDSVKQTKNISKLLLNLDNASASAGVSFKN